MAALDRETWEMWRQGHDQNMAEILTHIRTQQSINLDIEGRMSTVQATQLSLEANVNRRATWLSAVVSAIVGALTAAGLAAANSKLP